MYVQHYQKYVKLFQLATDGRRLKSRMEFVSTSVVKLQKLITSAYDELKKFSTEMKSFKTWIEVAFQVYIFLTFTHVQCFPTPAPGPQMLPRKI